MNHTGTVRGVTVTALATLAVTAVPLGGAHAAASAATRTLVASSADGAAFDLDEHDAADVTVQVTGKKPVDVDDTTELAVEKQTDMAAVTLVAPDGTRALPVFTSVESLAAWDPDARPVPVTASRAAQAAVSERCDVMVIDVAGPHTVALRPTMVWALAQQRPWLPAHEDAVVDRAVAAAVRAQEAVAAYHLEPGAAGEGVLRVVLDLRPGLTAEQVQELATAVGEQLATDGEVRARIDGLAFTIR